MPRDGFLDRPRTRVPTSAGELEVPVLVHDASTLVTYFHVDLRPAAELLAATPLAPARFARGGAIAALFACDCRASSAGPHRAIGTALAVVPRGVCAPVLPTLDLLRRPGHRNVGWHPLDVPATSATAEIGGRELWGLPRFTTEIDLDLAQDEILAVVQAPLGEAPIASLTGRLGPEVTLDAPDLVLYTVQRGQLLRTILEARGPMHTGFGRRFTLHVGRVDHPMADRLFALGLDGARPFAAQTCRDYRAVLHAGTPFGAVARAA